MNACNDNEVGDEPRFVSIAASGPDDFALLDALFNSGLAPADIQLALIDRVQAGSASPELARTVFRSMGWTMPQAVA